MGRDCRPAGVDAVLSSSATVTYHHSSLSPVLRYLVEDQIRSRGIRYVAATSTLAQGMNFPVATVLVHSVHKPRGGGNFSESEFWNIAGRAGRVGMVEQGLVLFANEAHREHWQRYAQALSSRLASALLAVLPQLRPDRPLKEQYREFPALRPFIQYLAHAAAKHTPERAIADLEELIQQSLANQQVTSAAQSQQLRTVGRGYLQQLVGRPGGILSAADQAGLATFSFDELYAKVRDDEVLRQGPQEILRQGEAGYQHLVEALRWIPELNLAIGFGSGDMDVQSVARVVLDWVGGSQVHQIANLFPGAEDTTRRRKAAQYLYSTVSQTISWGTHAYLRGWLLGAAEGQSTVEDRMLPAFIQYGVNTPEAAVASLLGVPRPFARAFGELYRQQFGELSPEHVGNFKEVVEQADTASWQTVTTTSGVADVNASDARAVFRAMQGIEQ